jgi:hypothetical protein
LLCRFPYRSSNRLSHRGIATPRADLITIVQQLPHLPRTRVAEATLDRQAAALEQTQFFVAKGRDDT